MHLRIAPFTAAVRSKSRPESGRSRLRRRLATLRSAYRRLGLAGAAVALSKAVPGRAPIAEWIGLFETTPSSEGGGEPQALSIRWGGRDDLHLLAALDRAPDELEARFDAGDRVCVALRAGRPVGSFWFRAGRWREQDLDFVIPREARWAYDAYVAPDARGQGVHPRMASWAAEQLGREGVRRYVSCIEYVNSASLRSAATRGARQVGSILVIRAPGLAVLRERWGERRPTWRVYRRSRGTALSIPAAGEAGA